MSDLQSTFTAIGNESDSSEDSSEVDHELSLQLPTNERDKASAEKAASQWLLLCISMGDTAHLSHVVESLGHARDTVKRLSLNIQGTSADLTPYFVSGRSLFTTNVQNVLDGLQGILQRTRYAHKISGDRIHKSFSTGERDQKFLADAQQQLGTRRRDDGSSHAHAAAVILKHLRHMRLPIQQPGHGRGQNYEAYFLSDADAKRLLESDTEIDVPVFTFNDECTKAVQSSQTSAITDLLHRLPFGDETFGYSCPRCPWNSDPYYKLDVAGIKKRFIENDFTDCPIQPLNFVDIPSPYSGAHLPTYLHGANCSFLTDLKRLLQNDCTNCPKPILHERNPDSIRQQRVLQRHWRHSDEVFILAEAGALTPPHWDPFGYATWITCLKGEIGFAWLSSPSDDLIDEWRENEDDCYEKGTWLYRVLRPGDSVYFGPGTVHLVFRIPEGEPTLAVCGHVLRRSDVLRWLNILTKQARDAVRAGSELLEMTEVVPLFMKATERLLFRPGPATKASADASRADMESNPDIKVLIGELHKILESIPKNLKQAQDHVKCPYHARKKPEEDEKLGAVDNTSESDDEDDDDWDLNDDSDDSDKGEDYGSGSRRSMRQLAMQGKRGTRKIKRPLTRSTMEKFAASEHIDRITDGPRPASDQHVNSKTEPSTARSSSVDKTADSDDEDSRSINHTTESLGEPDLPSQNTATPYTERSSRPIASRKKGVATKFTRPRRRPVW